MEMGACYVCVMVLCTSGLVGGGTVERLTGRGNVTVRCTDENNSRNEIQFWCNMENLICSSMEVSREIITIYQSSIQPSGRKLVFQARREGAQNSVLVYYNCQTEDRVNMSAVSTVPDPVTKASPGSHRDTPYRSKRDIKQQIKPEEAEESRSRKKNKEKHSEKKPKKNNKCKNKNKCCLGKDSTESTNSGCDGHGNPEGGKTEGGDDKTEGGDGKTEGGDGKTEGGDGKTEGGDGKTEGGDGKTEGGDDDDDGDGNPEGGDGKTEGGDDEGDGNPEGGKTEGGNGGGDPEGGNGGGDPEGGNGDHDAEGGTGGRGEHNGEVGDGRPDTSLVVLRSALGAIAVVLLILVACSVLLWIKRKPQSTLKAGGAGAQQGQSEKKVIAVYAKATDPGNAAPQPVYNATGHIYQEILDTPQGLSEKKVVTVYAKATNLGSTAPQPVYNAIDDIYQEVEGTPQDLAEVIHNSLYTPCEQLSQEQQSGPQGEPLANGQYSLLQLPGEQ